MMKTPVLLVAAALAVAILLAASFVIATGTRGENALRLLAIPPMQHIAAASPAAK
jgi:hypothetical protein